MIKMNQKMIGKLNILHLAITVLCLTSAFFINRNFVLVAFLLNVGFSFFLPRKYLSANLCFLVSFAVIYKTSADSSSHFTWLMLFTVALLMLRNFQVSVHSLATIIICIVYFIMGMLFSGKIAINEFVKQISNLLLLAILVNSSRKGEYKTVFIYFIFGVLVSSTIALFGDKIPDLYDYLRRTTAAIGVFRFSGLNNDPNYYSVNLIFAIVLLFILYLKRDIGGLYWGIGSSIFVIFGFMTYSKSFLLMSAGVVILLMIQIIKARKNNLLMLFLLVISFALFLLLEGKVIDLKVLFNRFSNDSSDILTGRLDLWKMYLEEFENNFTTFLFGVGIGADYLQGKGSHNIYIDFIYWFGVIGTAIWLGCISSCFKQKKHIKKRSFLNCYGLIIMLIMYCFLQGVFHYEIIFHLYLTYWIFNIDIQEKA